MSTPAVGKKAPAFKAAAHDGSTVRLADFKGKAVILYFYPKDNTPGCTQEGNDFRDHHPTITKQDAVVLGVSRDSVVSHQKFVAKFNFPFLLLSDPEEVLCRQFDVIKPKMMYGRETIGIERSTFLIDGQGILRREWRKVKVKGHVAEVLAALAQLG